MAAVLVAAGVSTVVLLDPFRSTTVAEHSPSVELRGRALVRIRDEVKRARSRAALLDRQARASTLASERATIAAAALGAKVQQAEAALAAADAELAEVRNRRNAIARRLARERAPATRLLAGLQTQLRQPPALTLLQPGSIEDAVRIRAVIAAIGPQIAARTTDIRGALARSQDLERQAAAIAAERRLLQSDLSSRRAELAAISAAEMIKAQRAASAADREAERAYVIASETRNLTTLVRRLEQVQPAQASGRAARTARENATPEFRLPADGDLLAAREARNSGVAIRTRPGALVVAPAAGRVAFAGPYRGYGTIVIVEHSNGWTSLVTGLAKARVAVGQMVVGGSPLGQSPDTDPRIGLEIRRNGKSIDPLTQMR